MDLEARAVRRPGRHGHTAAGARGPSAFRTEIALSAPRARRRLTVQAFDAPFTSNWTVPRGCTDSSEEKAEVLRDIARLTATPFLQLGPGSKEKKASIQSAAEALDVQPQHRTKQDWARALAIAGGQRWDQTCWSTGDTVTCVGLERVRAAVVLLAGRRDALRQRADSFVRKRLKFGTPEDSSNLGALKLRVLRPGKPIAISPEAFSRTTPPARRRVLLEKALLSHHETLTALSNSFLESWPQFEDRASVDLLVRFSATRALLIEVKSLSGDAVQVARLALGQLYEYQYRLNEPATKIIPALCFDRPLTNPGWLTPFLTEDRRINVLWPTDSYFAVRGPNAAWIAARLDGATAD